MFRQMKELIRKVNTLTDTINELSYRIHNTSNKVTDLSYQIKDVQISLAKINQDDNDLDDIWKKVKDKNLPDEFIKLMKNQTVGKFNKEAHNGHVGEYFIVNLTTREAVSSWGDHEIIHYVNEEDAYKMVVNYPKAFNYSVVKVV